MDPLFFYNLLARITLLLPIFSVPSILIGVAFTKKSTSIDIFSFRSKLFRFILLVVGSSLAAYVIVLQMPDTVTATTRNSVAGVFTIYVPLIAYGFFANSSAKRFLDMGRSKFFALFLAVPLVNLGVCYLLATSFTTKSTDNK